MRFAPHTDDEVRAMLDALRLETVDDLFEQIPTDVRLGRPLEPTSIFKLNTALQFMLICCVLAIRADYAVGGLCRDVLLAATLATVVLSGALYVREWSRRAACAHKVAAR